MRDSRHGLRMRRKRRKSESRCGSVWSSVEVDEGSVLGIGHSFSKHCWCSSEGEPVISTIVLGTPTRLTVSFLLTKKRPPRTHPPVQLQNRERNRTMLM